MTNPWYNSHHQQDVGHLIQHVSRRTSFAYYHSPSIDPVYTRQSQSSWARANHNSTECGQYHSGLPLSNLFKGQLQPSNESAYYGIPGPMGSCSTYHILFHHYPRLLLTLFQGAGCPVCESKLWWWLSIRHRCYRGWPATGMACRSPGSGE